MVTERLSLFSRRAWRLLKLVLVVGAVAGAVYWLKFAPIRVVEHQVTQGEIVAEVTGTGTLEAHYKSIISPRIAGRLKEVLVDQGAQVKAGAVLVRLDDVDMKPQVEIAEASVAVARSALDRLQADTGEAQAVLERAAVERQRALDLLPQNAISKSEVDKAVSDWKVAQAGVTRSEAALVEARMQLLAAETNLAYRKALFGDTEIIAPFDGMIVERYRDPGDIAVPGSSVLDLVSTEELWISAWVDETDMSRVAEGQPARVVFRSDPRHAYPGKVARLGRQADRETREFVVDVRVLEMPTNWAVGQRAEVYIETARKSGATLLPAQYLRRREDQVGVYVREAQRAAWRELQLGLRGQDTVEIMKGLEPGEAAVLPAAGNDLDISGRRISTP